VLASLVASLSEAGGDRAATLAITTAAFEQHALAERVSPVGCCPFALGAIEADETSRTYRPIMYSTMHGCDSLLRQQGIITFLSLLRGLLALLSFTLCPAPPRL
jgi:hypothetical protein